MRFAHLSDLHLGKRVNEFFMIDDQRYILEQILTILTTESIDAILLAGDIYDRSVPPVEAVVLFDEFLTNLAALQKPIFIISGNHDSAERLSFGKEFLSKENIHVSPVFNGQLEHVTLHDMYGELNIYLLPFIKPATIRRFYEEPIEDYTEAVSVALQHTHIDTTKRNILLAHQFVTGAVKSESEEISVGGLDNVSAEAFSSFDYVALGHIHRAQNVATDRIHYCGTPLKYSFSEANHQKSISIVTIGDKNNASYANLDIRYAYLTPLHDLREIRGTYEALTLRQNYIQTKTDDYLHVTLTDEDDIPDALAKLRSIYPHIMKLDYDNKRTRTQTNVCDFENLKKKSPLTLFQEFYHAQNNQSVNKQQEAYMNELISKIFSQNDDDS